MTAKFEIAAIWILGIVGYLSKHDFLFFVTITVQIIIGVKNTPGAWKVIKSFKKK
jgi:hypothetical protein